MATYNEKITRNTNWGGDASTGFLPVKGERVQEFIKEELNTKIGAVYKPDGINTVYYFANEDDKNAFIETDDMSYVMSSYEMQSNYDVKIDQESLIVSHSVLKGTTGNLVTFRFKIVDDNNMTADARAKIELSFTGSGISNKFTNEIPVTAGDWTQFSANVDDYLRDGSNNVSIKVVGMSTKATTQFVMTYNIFDLSFEVNFDYNKAKTGNTISVPYIIECSDTKYLEFFIDGQQVSSRESMVISDIRYDSTATLDISALSIGQHSLQVRAYVRATDGTLFYTPMHFFTFAKAGDAETSFLMYIVQEDGTQLVDVGENLSINLYQFEQIKFDWSIYDFMERKLTINFEYDGNIVSNSVVFGNETITTFNYRPMNYGDGKSLKIYAIGENDEKIFEYTIDVNVAETTSGIKEATDGLILKLQSMGRRNTDSDKDVWECVGSDGNTYRAEFSGFSWSSQQGWNEETESLVISNGATVGFNIKPMANDWAVQGGAVEIDLETFDIENEDAVICECANKLQENEAFFRITATKAEFSTSNGVSINTRYKDNEKLKIAFIGNRAGTHEDGYLIYIVVNGVLERAALYKTGDSIESFANLSIGDPTGQCKVRLRSIRVYNRAITVDQAFNNFVVDSDDVQGIYERNNVLKAGSATEVGFDEVANKLPVMIFTGDMDDIVNNGQDKEWRNFDVEYINRQEPERNFVSFNCQMKLQGTSSLGYPRKNFKLKTKDKNFSQELLDASKYELDPNSVVGNLMLRDKVTKETIDFDDFKTNGRLRNANCFTLDYEGKALKKGKYRFRKDAHKAQKWTLKADFMESSCSHNVGAGRSWNDIFENTELLDNGDASYTNQTYKDSALVDRREYIEYNGENIEGEPMHYKIPNNTQAIKDQKKYVCRTDAQKLCIAEGQDDVRTAVDGFPMVCFYRTSHAENNLVFLGQYNFINDKGSYEVFGFEDIEDPEDEETMIYDASKVECWEGLKNTNPLSLFKTDEGFYDWNADGTLRKWAETYEARYPDPEDYESDPSSLYELTKWIVSTRHEDDTVYGSTIDIDDSFARRINGYQYGYTDDTKNSYIYASGTNLTDNAENRQKKFETEKWEHFDVWKVAGYYVYLRRYGAVDQFVKNTMLFTDGNGKYDPRTDKKYRKWFFINYDNDCLFGLRNNGQLAFHWDLDRQTIDSASDVIIDDQADDEGADTNAYAMMGHDSTLWNNLERDDEFMRMVRDLDYSMSKYKLNYDNMVVEFDTKQTEMWCERIYNANERYKYIQAAKGIGDMEGKAVNNLWMLQGTRRSHRHWWIANHFNLLDAQWLSGDYKNTYVEIKTNCKMGDTIHAVAGAKYYYAWGQQKKIYQSNMQRAEGEAIDFVFPTDQSQGDPVYIYSFNKMTEMDFSDAARYVYEGSFKFVLGNDLVQNTMKKLIIGNPNIKNTTAQDTTTWEKVPNLEYLDITNYEGITYVPLNSFKNLHTFKAAGSKLGSFEPAEGSVFELVELPATVGTMKLTDVLFKNTVFTDLVYTPNTNLNTLAISSNDGVGIDYYNKIVSPWIDTIEASTQWMSLYRNKSLTLTNVKWSFNNLDSVRKFKHFSEYGKLFDMSGTIDLRTCGNLSMANIEEIKHIFGENCFNPKMSKLYVITPDSVFISSPRTEMVAGETNIFERVIYPDEAAITEDINGIYYYIVTETDKKKRDAGPGEIIFEDPIGNKNYLVINNVSSVRYGLTLTNSVDSNGKQIGVLSCEEAAIGTDTTFKVLVYMSLISSVAYDKVSVMDFTIKDPTYATTASIDGEKSLYKEREYHYSLSMETADGEAPIGSYSVSWVLTGAAVSNYVSSHGIAGGNQNTYVITMNSDQPDENEISSQMVLTATITNNDYYHSTVVASFNLLVLNETVIMTSVSNAPVMEICYNAGWASNQNAMTKAEAEAVTDIARKFKGKTATSFTFLEFKYFTGVTALAASAFQGSRITEIALPETIDTLGAYCFNECSSLKGVYVSDESVAGEVAYKKELPNGIQVIPVGAFRNCSSLNELTLPDSVKTISNFAFGGTGFEEAVLHSSEPGAKILRLSSNLELINGSAFETEMWTPSTTTNKLRRLEIPATMSPSDGGQEFLGRNYEEFALEENHIRFAIVDGVLFNKACNVLFRYPPKKGYIETFNTYAAEIIRPYAFFAVQFMDYLVLNGNVSNIGEGMCQDSKIKHIDISACGRIPDIKYDTFDGCQDLISIELPAEGTLKKIGTSAFSGCRSLTGITIPDGVEEFESDVKGRTRTFADCSSIEEVVFPNSVKKLGEYTLLNCPSLKNVVLPGYYDYTSQWGGAQTINPMENIPFCIIANCPNLESLTIPAFTYDLEDEEGNVSSVVLNTYNLSLERWYRVQSEFIPQDEWEPIQSTQDFYLLANDSKGSIKEIKISDVDNGEAYVSINGAIYSADKRILKRAPWNISEFNVENETEVFDASSFCASSVRTVNAPSGITQIGEDAFRYASNFSTSGIISSNLTSLGIHAFDSTDLRYVEISENLTSIPQYAFYSCQNLSKVVFNGFSGGIGRFAFGQDFMLGTIIVSAEKAPKILPIANNGAEEMGWWPFNGVGRNVGEKELIVSIGTSETYLRTSDSASTSTTYIITEESSWRFLVDDLNFAIKEEIPITGVSDVVIFGADGQPYTNTVYATSSLGHLVGLNDTVYSSTYDDGSYMFDLDGLYDGETVIVYSDAECTSPIGTFTPRVYKKMYQVGNPSFGAGRRSPMLLGSSVPEDTEMAEITKAEYDALVSRVNQMVKIIKKLVK